MGTTISGLTGTSLAVLADVAPVTQAALGLGLITRKATLGEILGANGAIYAGDPHYGVKADNTTDDTLAWNNLLFNASLTGAAVIAPMGISLVSNITIPSNVCIIGRNVTSYQTGLLGSTSLGSIIASTGANNNPLITMSPFSQMYGMQVVGKITQPAIRSGASGVTLEDITISGASIGLDFNTVGGAGLVRGCRIHECVTGIANPVGITFHGNVINNCSSSNLFMGAGSNHNIFTGNRFLWAGTNNISISTASKNTFTSNDISAAGSNNINLNGALVTVFTGNTIGRAGRNQGGTPGVAADANLFLTNCNGVIINDNNTWIGQNDGGSGYVGPYWAINDGGGNINCMIANNILSFNNNSTASINGPINVTSTFNLASTGNLSFWSGAI